MLIDLLGHFFVVAEMIVNTGLRCGRIDFFEKGSFFLLPGERFSSLCGRFSRKSADGFDRKNDEKNIFSP